MPPSFFNGSLAFRYGAAIVLPLVALAARLALEPVLDRELPFLIFVLAGTAAGWIGGFRPGLVAFAFGGFLSKWFFVDEMHSWRVVGAARQTQLAIFAIVGVLISMMAEALHRMVRESRARLKHANEASQALRESEERYRAFVATSHEAIWRLEFDEPIDTSLPVDEQVRLYFERAYYAEVNDALAKLYGFASAAEVPGLRLVSVEPPDHPETIASTRAFITGGYRRRGEVSHEKDRHGAPRNFLNNYVGMVENGKLTRVWGSSLDITEHKKAEAALREHEAILKAFYESSPACMGMVEIADNDILHLYDNPATCRLMRVPPGATVGRRSTDMGVDRAMVDEWLQHYAEAERTGGPVSFEIGREEAGKPLFWFSATVAPVPRGPSGQPRFCYIALNMTTRREFELQLAEAKARAEFASRSKDKFLAALSHELRNPLNPVLLTSSVEVHNDSNSPEQQELWKLVYRNISLQARLIDDLLDLTRITRGRLSMQFEQVDVHRVIHDAISTIQADVEARKQRLTVELAARSARLTGDGARLQQVFWNVLRNAVKFTPKGGALTISSSNPSGEETLRVRIADTGMGLTSEEQARIFEAFAQGDHACGQNAHAYGGLGLGLAISREIVQSHRGRIWAESDGRDCGSSFFVELPVGTEL